MNVIFISPHFPEQFYNFCDRLKRLGANVLGIGDCPYDGLSGQCRSALTEYYYVPSLEDYESVYRAVAFFSFKYGKIDFIDSQNEHWLELEARLREDFNVTTGFQPPEMERFRYKSAMKAGYKAAKVKTARWHMVDTPEECRAFIEMVGRPVIVKPDSGVGASDTWKLNSGEEFDRFWAEKGDKPYIIHFNYSFSEELLRADFAVSGEKDFPEYKNQLYVTLAERAAAYGWIMTAITAASPLLDSSFVEKGRFGEDEFNGMASTRCSELGYWNYFSPIFDYSSIRAYADSIQRYVDQGLLAFPTELYYPVRLKPRGKNILKVLRDQGVDHIELRMFDLNPLVSCGVDERDVAFAQLLLVWLAATPRQPFSVKDQIQAVQNFKNAAHYDLKTVKIVAPSGEVSSVASAALKVLDMMEDFYRSFPEDVTRVLEFQRSKFTDAENRYAWKIRRQFSGSYMGKALELAKKRQEEALHV